MKSSFNRIRSHGPSEIQVDQPLALLRCQVVKFLPGYKMWFMRGSRCKEERSPRKLAAAEEATALSMWTTTTICRALCLAWSVPVAINHNEMDFGRFLSCMGEIWHPECFRCHACNLPISSSEFSTSEDYPYHRACYREPFHLKCGVCNQFISSNFASVIEYRAHPFWDQKYCSVHETDGTPRCCSYERMEVHLDAKQDVFPVPAD